MQKKCRLCKYNRQACNPCQDIDTKSKGGQENLESQKNGECRMNKLNNIWNRFAEKHPSASKWIREGGLFVIVSNLITVLKYVMLLFLPLAFAGLPNIDFGFPGIDIT